MSPQENDEHQPRWMLPQENDEHQPRWMSPQENDDFKMTPLRLVNN